MPQQAPNYLSHLRARGFRVTPQRQLILAAIGQGGGHTTLDEIYQRVQATAPTINRATLYRTLDFLRAERLVVAAEVQGSMVYELAGETPHHHLICRVCGHETQLEHTVLKSLSQRIARDYGFAVELEHLALPGVCAQCQK